MKTLYLTLALLIFAASVNAQKYTMAYSDYSHNERALSHNSSLFNFKKNVVFNENFSYREFLRDSKNSKQTIQIGQHNFTKKGLAKLLRKSAIKTENVTEFGNYLNENHPQFTNNFSNKELGTFYLKFREGTLHKYIDELVSNW